MSLDAAVQLLKTALVLLTLVSTHPELPQSTRDYAASVAKNAITNAQSAILVSGNTSPISPTTNNNPLVSTPPAPADPTNSSQQSYSSSPVPVSDTPIINPLPTPSPQPTLIPVATTVPLPRFNMSDTPFLIRMQITNGTLQAGRVYIYFHDSGTGKDNLSELTGTKTAAYANANYDTGKRSLWGGLYTYDGDSCLIYNGQCYARVLGSLFPADASVLKNKYDQYVVRAHSDIPVLIGKVATAQSLYTDERSLATYLLEGANAYPYAYSTDMRTILFTDLTNVATALMAISPSSYYHSSYETTYGTPEFLTLETVVEALQRWKEVNPAAASSVNAYFGKVATELKNDGLETVVRKRNLDGTRSALPNAMGSYFTTTLALKAVGVWAFDNTFAQKTIDEIANEETVQTSQSTCFTFGQTYGGWPHDGHPSVASTCTQNMGYHRLITVGLLNLYPLAFDDNGQCRPGWENACPKLLQMLKSSLAWIYNVQDPTTLAIFDRAPNATSDAPTLYGTSVGLETASQIWKLLRKYGLTDTSPVQITFDGTNLTLKSIEDQLTKAFTSPYPGTSSYVSFYIDYRVAMLLK